MRVPAHLVRSRHGIFYLRWPLPRGLHPFGKASDLKTSLRTRDLREALHLSRLLGYEASNLIANCLALRMRYDELRAVIRQHFKSLLDRKKEEIGQHGPLSEIDLTALRNSQALSEAPDEEVYLSQPVDQERALTRFQELYGLSVEPGSPEFKRFRAEFFRGFRDFAKAAIAYNGSMERYDFDSPASGSSAAEAEPVPEENAVSLEELIKQYLAEGQRGGLWAEKTFSEKQDHLALLVEIIDPTKDVRRMTSEDARRAKEVVLRYPKNRNKNAKTRGLPLKEALCVEGVDVISIKTANTYIAAFRTLFEWARRNGFVDQNTFDGLRVRRGRALPVSDREAFSEEECQLMLRELVVNERGLVRLAYQRWGPLIGIFSGARLGEIAQLNLDDIKEHGGIWCFDFNDDDGKSLKTASSKRRVPIHPKLIELGLLEHVSEMREAGHKRLFPDFKYCPQNGWGRKLSRWFNERFLVKLKLKRRELVFHSLRHTLITRLSQANVAEPLVKALVGHAQDGVTQQHYFKEGYTVAQLAGALEHFQIDATPSS